MGGKVDASRKFAQAVVSLVASDNLSGVQEVNVTLMSPSGQEVRATWTNSYPSKRADVEIGIDMDSVTDNGTWRIFSVFVRDANYFGTLYDEAALNAMGGRTTFVVSGARGEQEAPVAEAGGINLTPVVSKSTPPGGMLPGVDARVAVQLKLRDLGASGIQTAALYYCLNGVMWDGCFHVHGGITVRGKTDVMLTMGGNVGTWLASGTYLPTWLNIYDHAGNSAYYERSFGHDLDALLDQPAIVIGD